MVCCNFAMRLLIIRAGCRLSTLAPYTIHMMLQRPDNQLRQIKWLLAAILVCLILIALAVVPGLLIVLLMCAIIYGIGMVAFSISSSFRNSTELMWNQITSLWRR